METQTVDKIMSHTIARSTELNNGIGPNAMNIRKGATKVIRGKMPAAVRKELMAAVKAGSLGRLPKKGLLPEVFFHPDHKNGAKDRQRIEAEYSARCIAGVVA
jgi:hypothetical protein